MTCRRPAGLEAYAGQHALRTGVANAAGLLGVLHDGRPNVTFRTEAAKHIRLYFTWDKASKIEDVVATFNKFERIHVSIENQTLVVESNEATR